MTPDKSTNNLMPQIFQMRKQYFESQLWHFLGFSSLFFFFFLLPKPECVRFLNDIITATPPTDAASACHVEIVSDRTNADPQCRADPLRPPHIPSICFHSRPLISSIKERLRTQFPRLLTRLARRPSGS